ncbi:MAG TPA: hypothetical protein VMV59_06955 [Candidatus Dormibacteraeota bacterium]|nr:hypothetical protein [Candidatus Dormibacteraeota bacterium]
MSNLQTLIEQMRAAGGWKRRSPGAWIAEASQHDGLKDALNAVFKKKPAAQTLGFYLTDHLGAMAGDLRLTADFSTHKKAKRYGIVAPTDDADREAERLSREAALAKHERDYRAFLAEKAAPPPPVLKITVQAPVGASILNPDMDYIATTDRDGKITRTALPPVTAKPEPKLELASAQKPVDAIQPRDKRALSDDEFDAWKAALRAQRGGNVGHTAENWQPNWHAALEAEQRRLAMEKDNQDRYF